MKECPKCHTLHDKNGTFCSRKCANSRTWSEQDKIKKSISAKNSCKVKQSLLEKHTGIKITKRIVKVCLICKKEFEVTLRENYRKYCSKKCYLTKAGGYVEGSGCSKSGYYKGIYCGSTYELCWVIYNLDRGILFKRFSGFLELDNIKYFPDFIIGNTIFEIKGYHTPLVDKKSEIAKYYGYDIKVLYGIDLQHTFDYVSNKYNTKKYYDLYDKYKPKYSYICNCCGKLFQTDTRRKTELVYCSRSCCGKRLR